MTAPDDLAALPKAELHIHLEGSVRPATLEELAAREGVRIPASFHDLNSFVEIYMLAWRTMVRPGDYRRLVREYCEDAARSGIRYAELQMGTIGRTYDHLAEALEELHSMQEGFWRAGFPVFHSLERAARAISYLLDWRARRD